MIVVDWNVLITIATFSAALGAFWSARNTQKAAEAQILLQLLSQYSSLDMMSKLETLRSYEMNKNWFCTPVMEEQLNIARRGVKHFFFSAAHLYRAKFVSDEFMVEICRMRGFDMLFDTVKPLEAECRQITPEDEKIYDILNQFRSKIVECDLL